MKILKVLGIIIIAFGIFGVLISVMVWDENSPGLIGTSVTIMGVGIILCVVCRLKKTSVANTKASLSLQGKRVVNDTKKIIIDFDTQKALDNNKAFLDSQDKGWFMPYNMNSDKYTINKDEEEFLNCLTEKIKTKAPIPTFKLERMADGALNVFSFEGIFIGKVRLQKKKHWFMYMKNLDDFETIEGELHDFIPYIDEWIKFIKKYK